MTLIVAAMHSEAVNMLQNIMDDTDVIITGVGKVNAAMNLTWYIANAEKPIDRILNLGFAGASAPYQVSDVVLIEQATYHDFDLTLFGYEKGQVPTFPVHFSSDPSMVRWIQKVLPNIKKGQLFTGDYFMTVKKEAPVIVDMEGAALYQVAYRYDIPIASIKIVSDILGMDQHYASYKAFEAEQGAQMLHEVYVKLFGGKQQ